MTKRIASQVSQTTIGGYPILEKIGQEVEAAGCPARSVAFRIGGTPGRRRVPRGGVIQGLAAGPFCEPIAIRRRTASKRWTYKKGLRK